MIRAALLAPPSMLLLLLAAYTTTAAAAAFLHHQRQPHPGPAERPQRALPRLNAEAAPDRSLFVFGLGYVGRRLAADLHAARGGWRVQGTSTKPFSAVAAAAPRSDCVPAFAFDPTAGRMLDPAGLAALRGATHLLVSIPPLRLGGNGAEQGVEEDEERDTVLACYGEELRRRCPRLEWVGYLSSTSVYGDRGGGWVAEADPPAPVSRQGKARVRAEEGWAELVQSMGPSAPKAKPPPPPRLVVFRLAGIYGPGRSALDTLRRELEAAAGRAERGEGGGGRWPLSFQVDGTRPVSRVHVDDIVRAVRCALERGVEGTGHDALRVFNVADDRPASRLEVFSYAARLLASGAEGGQKHGTPLVDVVPKTEEGEAGPPSPAAGPPPARTRSRRQPESKRVDNRRLKEELLARCFPEQPLLYKDYEAGLAAIWEATRGGGGVEG